jgi:hypothetical protein
VKIRIVVPYLERVAGQRVPLTLAAEMARSADVAVIVHTIGVEALPAAKALLGSVPLQYRRTRSGPPVGMGRLVTLQLRQGMDRWISEVLRREPGGPPDVVFVVGNEGHALGHMIRRWRGAGPPRVHVGVFELLDYPFLFRHERPHPLGREVAMPLYPLAHWIEGRRLRSFDRLFSISRWTEGNLAQLYGLRSSGTFGIVDLALFRPNGASTLTLPSQYVALPTAALDAEGSALVAELVRRRVPFVAFGSHPAPGTDYRGFVRDIEMVEILRRAAVTFFPFDYEALGLLPLESLACGTPVVTIPKQGTHAELAGNRYVEWAAEADAIEAACRRWLDRPPTAEDHAAAHATVTAYAPGAVAARLLRSFESDLSRPSSESAR